MTTADAPALAADVTAWIESVTGMAVTSARPIPAGGRRGWFVDVAGDGAAHELFLQSGRGLAAPSSFRGFDVEAEVYRALRPLGVPVPRVWGVDAGRELLLVDRIPGTVWFRPPPTEEEQVSVARDFVRHLATWHRAGAEALDLPSLGPVKTWREHQLDQLARAEAMVAEAERHGRVDPLVTHTMAWLRANVPDAEGPVVLVQGDTGPGNFLYRDGRVTGIVDWELAHLGDPMDDIAWLSWRATQHSFTHFPDRIREYEELSGIEVDESRVRYYRLNAFARLGPHFGLADMGRSPVVGLDGGGPPEVNRAADGSALVLATLHRRMRLDAMSDAMGLDRPPREVDEAPEPAHAGLYDRILEQLRGMVPRIDDPAAASTAKAIARQLKYLRELDRNGELFAAQELEDLGELLGRRPASLAEGRAALVDAVHEGRVAFEDYVAYHWRRLRRDDHLMRHASGALYERAWPPLR
jgi:aminoglycoside phosphotransferase (APT) family kinase protein